MPITKYESGREGGISDRGGNSDVLICFAVKEEVGFNMTRAPRGCTVLVTGMGRKNASESVRTELEDDEYQLVLTCGFAGGLNTELRLGTILFDSAAMVQLAQAGSALGGLLALVIAPIATELPEKFNSVIWVRQGKDTLSMGNITGAMVFQSASDATTRALK